MPQISAEVTLCTPPLLSSTYLKVWDSDAAPYIGCIHVFHVHLWWTDSRTTWLEEHLSAGLRSQSHCEPHFLIKSLQSIACDPAVTHCVFSLKQWQQNLHDAKISTFLKGAKTITVMLFIHITVWVSKLKQGFRGWKKLKTGKKTRYEAEKSVPWAKLQGLALQY